MLTGIVGKLGQGKTAFMTYLACKDYIEQHRNVLANYRLNFIKNQTFLDMNELLNPMNKTLDNSTICIDEGWIFFDSRTSTSKNNLAISQTILQSRKRGCDVYITAQAFNQIDKRFRNVCDYVVFMQRDGDFIYPKFWIKDLQAFSRKKYRIYLPPLYSLYNTNELINPNMIKQLPNKKELMQNGN